MVNKWNSQSFSKTLNFELKDKRPPSVVGKLNDIALYYGQDKISFVIPPDLFYDPDGPLLIFSSHWYSDNITVTISSETDSDCKFFIFEILKLYLWFVIAIYFILK